MQISNWTTLSTGNADSNRQLVLCSKRGIAATANGVHAVCNAFLVVLSAALACVAGATAPVASYVTTVLCLLLPQVRVLWDLA